jgi:hypothetical protein
MSDTIAHTQTVDGGTESSPPTGAPNQRKASADGARVPEWTTERWRHRVEAEARNRLKHDLHDVGAPRR